MSTQRLEVDRIELVLELDSADFATREHPHPDATGAEDPAGWHEHWLRCLADAGIEGLDSVALGSGLVAPDALRDPAHLEALCLATIGSAEDNRDTEAHQAGTLWGGLAFFTGEELLLGPQCCCDLESLSA